MSSSSSGDKQRSSSEKIGSLKPTFLARDSFMASISHALTKRGSGIMVMALPETTRDDYGDA